MKWFSGIRVIALLRRIARALEEQNEIARTRFDLDFPNYARKEPGRKRKGAVISRPSVEELNEAWRNRSRIS